MRFGLEPYAPMTLREVGENLGLTRERVRQLENQALLKLMAVLGDDAEPRRATDADRHAEIPRSAALAAIPRWGPPIRRFCGVTLDPGTRRPPHGSKIDRLLQGRPCRSDGLS